MDTTTIDKDMGMYGTSLPTDLSTATKEIISLRIENTDLKRTNDEQQEQIRIMKAREYGRSSEKRTVEDIRQGKLFDEAEVYSTPEKSAEAVETVRVTKTVYTRKKRGRTPISPKLARVEVVVDLGEDERNAVPEGYCLARIGEETSEQVHEIPQKYVVIKTIRPKYIVKPVTGNGQKKSDTPFRTLIAPVPARILPRSIATPSLLSSVLTGKFCDALPFYRQEKMFRRFGLEISRQDMANWTIAVAAKLEVLIDLMKAELLSAPFMHCDETYFQVMDEDGRANTTKSYMWVMTGGTEIVGTKPDDPEGDGPKSRRVVLYRYHPSREADFISKFLAQYTGFLQTDGYSGYNAIGEKEGIIHVACWAHARRRFVEAFEATMKKGSAGEAIEMIGRMYRHERNLRLKYFGDNGIGDPDAFIAERRTLVSPIVDELKAWLDAKSLEVLPKSALGTAISYTLDLWPRLIRYLDCPFLTPDNNEAERAIRPFTVGRNNWVLSGGPRGATASATIYSIIETLKLNGLEPYYALRHILTRLPLTPAEQVGDLLPWNLDSKDFYDLVVEDARISLDSTAIF
jgi:transposase